jgi:hypothetical protein
MASILAGPSPPFLVGWWWRGWIPASLRHPNFRTAHDSVSLDYRCLPVLACPTIVVADADRQSLSLRRAVAWSRDGGMRQLPRHAVDQSSSSCLIPVSVIYLVKQPGSQRKQYLYEKALSIDSSMMYGLAVCDPPGHGDSGASNSRAFRVYQDPPFSAASPATGSEGGQ